MHKMRKLRFKGRALLAGAFLVVTMFSAAPASAGGAEDCPLIKVHWGWINICR